LIIFETPDAKSRGIEMDQRAGQTKIGLMHQAAPRLSHADRMEMIVAIASQDSWECFGWAALTLERCETSGVEDEGDDRRR
jgi:hypothetical protein